MHGRLMLAATFPLAVLLVGAVPAAAAPPTAVPVACEARLADADAASAFVAGQTFHLRGWTGTYASTGSLLCTGTTYVFPSHVDVSMGLGVVQGGDQYVLSGIDGGWLGTYVQHWAYPEANTYGIEIARGYGALEGWQLRTHLVEYFDGTIIETGYAFPPGS
ncbi:MAG TPA: hypothetical protein VF763_07130 [Candidatus Limnocylindrales bacterium]